MRILTSWLLSAVVVAGCSKPPESADGGAGSEGDKKDDAQSASGDLLDCKQLKPLLEEAASISQAELEPVFAGAIAPRLPEFSNQPFTVLSFAIPSVDPDESPFVLGEASADEKHEWFHFLNSDNANPAEFFRAIEIDSIGLRYSLLKQELITDCECEVKGDIVKGTASFTAPELFAGKVSFVATRSKGKWQVTEFRSKAEGIGTVLKDGTWQAYPKERFHPSTIAALQLSDEELQTKDDGSIVLDPVESGKSSRFDFSIFVGKDFVRIDGIRDESNDAAVMERRIRDAKERYLDKGTTPPRVRVLAHPEVSMESVLQTIKLCQSAGLERIECWFGPKIEVYSPQPVEAEIIEEPPMRLDLRAAPDGKLASLHFADRQFDSLEELHDAAQHFSAGSGTTGPDALKVVISVDPHLRMDEFARAYEAAVQTRAKDGKPRALVAPENVYFRNFSPFIEVEAELSQEEFELQLESEPDISAQEIKDIGEITDVDISAVDIAEIPVGEGLDSIAATKDPLLGRSHVNRARLVRRSGGTAQSEAAVARALEWLAKHQNKDGSWSFSNTDGVRFGNPGRIESKMGATGMALLPFLGAGYTHKEGKYKSTVWSGLSYLAMNMSSDAKGRLVEKNVSRDHMFVQALATTALAEAYGMTQDAKLREPAQRAVDYIVAAQDLKGGGWRFEPRQPGSTIMTGWQIMALKSAHLAGLKMPQSTIIGAGKFLDSVASDEGARYGYRAPKDRPEADTTTAIGLSCRMLLGWERDNPALGKGIKNLAGKGTSKEDMLFNLFATQAIMNHTSGQGETWQKWNRSMRDLLIETQENRGSDAGSWHFRGREGDEGGRLYNTVLAALILETYYRLPIYQDRAVELNKWDLE